MSEHVRTLTTEDWLAAVESCKGLILVDFWASWCPPCRKLGPVVDALAAEYAGRLAVGKLNVDEQPEIAERHRIVSIPTLILFRDGRLVDRWLGAIHLEDLRGLIDGHLEAEPALR